MSSSKLIRRFLSFPHKVWPVRYDNVCIIPEVHGPIVKVSEIGISRLELLEEKSAM